MSGTGLRENDSTTLVPADTRHKKGRGLYPRPF